MCSKKYCYYRYSDWLVSVMPRRPNSSFWSWIWQLSSCSTGHTNLWFTQRTDLQSSNNIMTTMSSMPTMHSSQIINPFCALKNQSQTNWCAFMHPSPAQPDEIEDHHMFENNHKSLYPSIIYQTSTSDSMSAWMPSHLSMTKLSWYTQSTRYIGYSMKQK